MNGKDLTRCAVETRDYRIIAELMAVDGLLILHQLQQHQPVPLHEKAAAFIKRLNTAPNQDAAPEKA